jgi:hypothetical protein
VLGAWGLELGGRLGERSGRRSEVSQMTDDGRPMTEDGGRGTVGSEFVGFGVGRFRGQRERWTTNGGTAVQAGFPPFRVLGRLGRLVPSPYTYARRDAYV